MTATFKARRLWCGCRPRTCPVYGTGVGLVVECPTCGSTVSEWDLFTMWTIVGMTPREGERTP